MSHYQSKKFKCLQAKWYDALRNDGFKDAEKNEYLINWDSQYFMSHYSPTNYEAKESYYRYAGFFLNEYKFKNRRDKIVWEYHSMGIPIRDIAVTLKVKKWIIEKIIKELKQIMLIEMKNES